MNHTIYATKVNECTVGSDGFNNTRVFFASFNRFPELVFKNFSLLSNTEETLANQVPPSVLRV